MGLLGRDCSCSGECASSSLERADFSALCLLRHLRSILAVGIKFLIWAAVSSSLATAQFEGITSPQFFAPHDANAPRCRPPEGRQKTLAFAQDNDRDFMQGVSNGLALAAKDRGLAYQVAVARNDAARMMADVENFFVARVGAVVAAPVDSEALSPTLKKLIGDGAYVGTVVPPPAVTILNAPQYLTGKTLAEAAAAHIRQNLSGKANVVLLTHDSLEFLAPRFVAMRDVLREIPGVVIVADISPPTVDQVGGFATMSTILLANAQIDVVLGADTVVLGALKATRAARRIRADQFFGGIDGELDAVAELKSKDSPYRASISLASPIFGYAMGQHAADWLKGKSVPQGIDILPRALTRETIAAYEADVANPRAVYNDAGRRDLYLKMYGNICYDTRDRYVNFPWNSEQR
jgi:ribose transport system substrate-binding protein